MLNPGASEFKPTFVPSVTDETGVTDRKTSSPSSAANKQLASSQPPANKNRHKTKRKNKPGPTLEKNATDPVSSSVEKKPPSRLAKESTLASQQDPSSSSRRKPQTPAQQKAAASSSQAPKKTRRPPKAPERPTVDLITEQPATSFITIDQTIDPVHVVMQSTPSLQKNTLVHGYDHYVAWIERCLQVYPVVTVVGMDPAMADVISLVTMVQLKGVGSYHELATFSMVEGEQQPTCGIQVKLHRTE